MDQKNEDQTVRLVEEEAKDPWGPDDPRAAIKTLNCLHPDFCMREKCSLYLITFKPL